MKFPKILKRFATYILVIIVLYVSGLITFYALRPEGKFTLYDNNNIEINDPNNIYIKLTSWNIQRGQMTGIMSNKWPDRKKSFQTIFKNEEMDILCLQEALPGQVDFFQSMLTDFNCIAAGRIDGKNTGEHCPVYFHNKRFILEKDETFWLSDTPEKASKDWGEIFPRICTWVQLKDLKSGIKFRVYNIHMPLVSYARQRSAKLLIQQIKQSGVPSIIVGDFNASPNSKTIKMFYEAGFISTDSKGALTHHISGKGIRCLDHILHDENFNVTDGKLLKEKGGKRYPSDHFGINTTLVLQNSIKKTQQ